VIVVVGVGAGVGVGVDAFVHLRWEARPTKGANRLA
jgi:hypothetical protein